MREGASRVFGCAVLTSILLHALLLAALPSLREFAAPVPPEPEPLIARVERLAPPRAPRAPEPAPEMRRPPEPRAQPAPRRAEPVENPAPSPEPVLSPEPAPSPEPTPPETPAPVQSASPPLVRVAPMNLAPEVPAPDAAALQRYHQDVTGAAARFKRYPRVAIDNNWQGEVVVRMAIDASGRIALLRVQHGSGHAVLDRQALQMFESAKSLVAIPRELRGRQFELELRAIYGLRDQRSG